MRRKMVSLRFTSLIMVSLFVLQALRSSLAHAHQAKVTNNFDTSIQSENGAFGRKAKFDQELARPNNEVVKAKKAAIGGRKMANIAHEVEEDDSRVMKKATPMVVSGATKVNDSIGFEVKGDLDHVLNKVNDDINDHHSSMKLNEAFCTLDYRGPRSHPSKHH